MRKAKAASNVVRFDPSRKNVRFQLLPYRPRDVVTETRELIKDMVTRHALRKKLRSRTVYFIPIQFMAEALDMTVDSLRDGLSEDDFEIVNDRGGELTQSFGQFYREPVLDSTLYVTTFGMQRLMGRGSAK